METNVKKVKLIEEFDENQRIGVMADPCFKIFYNNGIVECEEGEIFVEREMTEKEKKHIIDFNKRILKYIKRRKIEEEEEEEGLDDGGLYDLPLPFH